MIDVRRPRRFRPEAAPRAKRRGRVKCELYRQYCRVLRSEFSCTAKIDELQFRLAPFFPIPKLRQRAFEDRSFVVENSGGIDSAFQKSSGETIRDTLERYRCKSKVVLLDVESLETKSSAVN